MRCIERDCLGEVNLVLKSFKHTSCGSVVSGLSVVLRIVLVMFTIYRSPDNAYVYYTCDDTPEALAGSGTKAIVWKSEAI